MPDERIIHVVDDDPAFLRSMLLQARLRTRALGDFNEVIAGFNAECLRADQCQSAGFLDHLGDVL
jgi:hypothetical protein